MDLYEILNIPRNATEDEVKKAYRQKAKEYHPDVNPDNPEAEAKFKEVASAYEVLSDRQKKQNYDTFGSAEGQPSQNFGYGGFGGFNFGGGFSVENLFEQFFGRGGATQININSDINMDILLTPKEFLLGCTKKIHLTRSESCRECKGAGGFDPVLCTSCMGKGVHLRMTHHGPMMIQQTLPCDQCKGKGNKFTTTCDKCSSSGIINTPEDIDLNIPPNCPINSTLQIGGRGNRNIESSPPGSLNITLNPDESGVVNITRDGSIHITKEVKLEEWYNNSIVKINRYDVDEISYDMANFTQSDKRVNFAGRGLRSANNDAQGDFIVAFRITK